MALALPSVNEDLRGRSAVIGTEPEQKGLSMSCLKTKMLKQTTFETEGN